MNHEDSTKGRIEFSEFVTRLLKLRKKISSIVTEERYGPVASIRASLLKNDTVEQLLYTAYYASFIMDEGRKSITKLSWLPKGLESHKIIEFEPRPSIDSPKLLAKLSQIVHPTCSLEIVEEESPKISAIVSAEPAMSVYVWPRARHSPYMSILVRDPGHIEFYEVEIQRSYKQGIVSKYTSILKSPNVQKWLNELNQSICSHLRVKPSQRDFCSRLYSVNFVLGDILNRVISRRHGGMIVIVPEDSILPIKFAYEVRSKSLRDSIARHWETSYSTRCQDENGPERTHALKDKSIVYISTGEEAARENINQQVRGVAQLANMDGCLVFDRDLQMLGFGGVIQAQDQSEKSESVLRNRFGMPLDVDVVLRSKGTRHRAAYQLCRAIPGAIAFVISQDGDMRIFSSDSESVCFEDEMRP